MAVINRRDRRTPGTDKWGVPDVSYEESSQAHPTILETITLPTAQTPPAFLEAHEDTANYPGASLVEIVTQGGGDNRDTNYWLTYKTLPGPWVINRVLLRGTGTSRVFRETKRRSVVATTYPSGGTKISTATVEGQSVTEAMEVVITDVNVNGTAISSPVYAKVEIDWKFKVYRITYRQQQDYPGTLPVLGAIDNTVASGIYVEGTVASLTVTSAGSGYSYVPIVTIARGLGTQATAIAIMQANAVVSVVTAGTGYTPGNVLTAVGGTGTVSTFTVSSVGLVGVTLNPAGPGSGYAAGNVLTLVNGTFGLAAQVTVATTLVRSATVAAAGSGGTDGTQTVTGTTGTGTKFQASVTVAGGVITAVLSITVAGSYTVNPTTPTAEPVTGASLTGAQLNVVMGINTFTISRAGTYTGSLPGSFSSTGGSGSGATFLTPAWGINTPAITTAGTYTALPPMTLASAVVFNRGVGYRVGDTITLAGGTGTAAVLTVTAITSGKVKTFTVTDGGSYSVAPTGVFTQESTRGALLATWTVDPGTDLITTSVAHGLTVGEAIEVSTTGTLPDGTAATAVYYVKTTPAANTLTLSDTPDLAATFDFTDAGTGTQSIYRAGGGSGAQFTPTFKVVVATTGGTGTGATLQITYAVASLTVTNAGSNYASGSSPAVDIPGPATATATVTVTTGGWQSADAQIVDGWIEEPVGEPRVWVTWVTMPLPPWRYQSATVPFVRPGFANIPLLSGGGGVVEPMHNPPWLGIDWTYIPPFSGEWVGTEEFQYGWSASGLPACFGLSSPGAGSRFFNMAARTIHNAFIAFDSNGNYAEDIPASTVVGYYPETGYLVVAEQRNIIGNLWEVHFISTFAQA